MTIRHMKIFLQVYSLESITKAAEILNMTQPNVTRAIQEMERYYGVCLFERIGHRLSRTAVGQEFYAHALHIVEAFDRMEKELRDWDEIGKIRLGATNTLGCFFLPDLLLQFQKQYPKLEIVSTVTNADALQSGLLNNQYDLALIEGIVSMPGLHAEPFAADKLLLVLPPGHELAKKEKIFPSDVEKYPLLLREQGSTTHSLLEHFFFLHHIEAAPVFESCNPQALIQAVQCGLGISFLPERWVKELAKEGKIVLREMPEEGFKRENYVVWHENKFLTKTMKMLINVIKEKGQGYLNE